MTALVIGANGYLGSHVTRQLAAAGEDVRVMVRAAANTIGMQMAGSSLGGSLIPGLVGVLARRFSLEVIPICLFVFFALLFATVEAAGQLGFVQDTTRIQTHEHRSRRLLLFAEKTVLIGQRQVNPRTLHG